MVGYPNYQNAYPGSDGPEPTTRPDLWAFTVRDLNINDRVHYRWMPDTTVFGFGGVQQSFRARPGRHGVTASVPDLGDVRPMILPVGVQGSTEAEILEALAALGAAFAPGDTVTATITTPWRTFVAQGRTRPPRPASLATIAEGWLRTAVEFTALDPRLYDADLSTAVADLTTGATGLGFPHAFPHAFGSYSPGNLTATNDGDAPVSPYVVIGAGDAGLIDPAVEHVTTGQRISLDMTVLAGQYVHLDFDRCRAWLSTSFSSVEGAADIAAYIERPGSDWWELAPGPNPVRFTGQGAGTVTVSWRHAWWL